MSAVAHKVRVELDERGYDIVIGSALLPRAAEWIAPALKSPRAIIIADAAVERLYAKPLAQALAPQGIKVESVIVPSGEGSKSFAALERLMEQLLAFKPDRKTTLIAVGGGVVGDLVGFAASSLLRGVPFIQVPTTLLSQVDSSVGGKTAINARAGKNLIGSFYQPSLVLADLDTLSTLPAREMRAGYAEIIKYGLIRDADFYKWCLSHGEKILAGDAASLQQAIMRSVAMKAEIVADDEREADTRALLNFGHTFAHALEAETGFSDKLLHGEAVAIGMAMACRLSAKMGLVSSDLEKELSAHFTKLGMPASPRDIDAKWNAERITAHFAGDKKAEGGALTFIVLESVGKARVAKNVDAALAKEVVASYLE